MESLKYMQIENGRVTAIVQVPKDQKVQDIYHDILDRIYPAPPEVEVGWRLIDGELIPPPPEPAHAQEWSASTKEWVYNPRLDPPSFKHTWDEKTQSWFISQFSPLEFTFLFQPEETISLDESTKSMVRYINKLFDKAQDFSIRDGRTIWAILKLVEDEILSPNRAATILHFYNAQGQPDIMEAQKWLAENAT